MRRLDLSRAWIAVLMLIGMTAIAMPSCATQPAAVALPGVDQLPAIEQLPDPFVMNDGSRVRTREDWTRRREQLKEMILHYEYGRLPPPAPVSAKELSSATSQPFEAVQKEILLAAGPAPDRKVEFHLRLTMPPEPKGRLPVIVSGDLAWHKVVPPAVKEAVRRGYIVVELNREEVAPDKNDRTRGVYTVYPDCDCGALAAWAWGFHRTVDYLLSLDCVDANRVAVTGHSRGGKAALLAGALDERVALTVPNGSGAGGASVYRVTRPDAESLTAITNRFPYWFHPRFKGFQGKETHLPFDQHSLRALVAPRALLSTEATGDLWANPAGNQQAHLAAREVYAFLGAADRIGIHYRPGKHAQNEEDWTAMLDFADLQFFGKAPARKFDQLPLPDEPKAFTWSAPAPAGR